MEVRFFSAKGYDRESFTAANLRHGDNTLVFLDARLDQSTVVLAEGADAVCVFVNDDLGATVLTELARYGVRYVALRCAGFNNVDLPTAAALGISVVRVPAYSPNAVAEHTLALILALNRHIPRAYTRVRDGNFALEGLLGFDLAGKTAGVIGTGRIGALVARLLWHFRCRVLAYDPMPNEGLIDLGVEYVDLEQLWRESDLITLNCPLTEQTHHLVNADTITQLKPGVMVVNTGRGALLDTTAAVEGLKTGRIGSLALDVYEEEAQLFFEDRSQEIIADDVFSRLLTFPNVLITAHQGFFTREALASIADVTLQNLDDLACGALCINRL